MPFVKFKLKDGTEVSAHVCGPRRRIKRCDFCGRAADYLCDGPVSKNGRSSTCSARICGGCRVNKAPEVDLCPTCVKRNPGEQLELVPR